MGVGGQPDAAVGPERRLGRTLPLLTAVVIVLVVGAVGVLSIVLGTTHLMPDNLHTTYGFPLTWGWHLTESIAGPVDRWTVDLGALAIDLMLWLGATAVAIAAVGLVEKRGNAFRADSGPDPGPTN